MVGTPWGGGGNGVSGMTWVDTLSSTACDFRPVRRKEQAVATSVADLCQQRQMTIAELTAASGLEEQRVTAIALGRWTPSPAERKKIADVFGLPIEEVSWGHKTPIQHIYGHGPG
jgi:cyanate lyase